MSVEFHKETVVPSGAMGINVLSKLLVLRSGFPNQLAPGWNGVLTYPTMLACAAPHIRTMAAKAVNTRLLIFIRICSRRAFSLRDTILNFGAKVKRKKR